MGDISTLWDPAANGGDWSIEGADLATGDDLATAVLISLFTDRRVDAEDVPPDGTSDRRGWWGDSGRTYPLGSKLWLLERAKQTEETRLRAQDYVAEALQWLIDAGIADSLDVVAAWQRPGFLGVKVTLFEPDGSVLRDFNYEWAWKGVS